MKIWTILISTSQKWAFFLIEKYIIERSMHTFKFLSKVTRLSVRLSNRISKSIKLIYSKFYDFPIFQFFSKHLLGFRLVCGFIFDNHSIWVHSCDWKQG